MFLYLPKELIVHILQFTLLDGKSKLFDLSSTCKQFDELKNLLLLEIDCSRDNYPNLRDSHLIKFSQVLKSIYLCYNDKITDEGIKSLTNLTSIYLRYNDKITDEGIKSLTNLTSIDLCHNDKITNEGIKLLTNLTFIDLRYNDKITNEGIKSLTKLILVN